MSAIESSNYAQIEKLVARGRRVLKTPNRFLGPRHDLGWGFPIQDRVPKSKARQIASEIGINLKLANNP